MHLFEPICESLHCRGDDPSSAIGFTDFLDDNWQTNGYVSLRYDCSALF